MQKQSGLSLIELMIAMVIGLVLMLGVSQIFLSTRQVYANQGAVSRTQETGRLAIEFLTRDTRMAGYTGCASSVVGSITNKISSPSVLQQINVGIQGVDGVSPLPSEYGITRVAGTDVLTVRGLFGNSGIVSATNTANSISMNVTAANVESGACADSSNRVNGICAGDIAVMSSCLKAEVFRVTDVNSSGEISAGDALTPGIVSQGGEVGAANTIIYFIRVNPAGNRSLYQKIDGGNSVELLEGVDNMQLLYGRDGNGDGIPEQYVSADSITTETEWAAVSSVRVQLLVSSVDDNVVADKQPYTFNGTSVSNPGDKRLRQVFVSTIAIRSRLPKE